MVGGGRRGATTLTSASDAAAEPNFAWREHDAGPDDRIAQVDVSIVEAPLDRFLRAYGSSEVAFVLVRVLDASGRRGIGFTYTLNLGASAVRTMLADVLGPLLVGTSPAAWADTYGVLARQTRRLGRSVFAPAMSALDIAMYDLRATQFGVPLYRLLGRDPTAVEIYGSGRSSNSLDLERLVEGSIQYVAEGYRAVKLRVGARPVAGDVERVAAVRAAVGPDVSLMVDANEQLKPAQAASLVGELQAFGVAWLEEPFLAEDVAAHVALAARSPIPIAAGEHLVGPYEFDTYLRSGAAQVFQPDAALTGGLTAAQRIAALAEARTVPVAFHSLPELHVHLAMGASNVRYVEHFPVLDPLLAEPLSPSNGLVTARDIPGHGIVWSDRVLDSFRGSS